MGIASDSDSVARAYDTLKEKISEFSSYGLFIEFKIGSIDVSTNSEKGYLMNLRYDKTGTGTANQFTLQIAFCPDPEGTTVIDTNFLDFATTIAAEECKFRYGYVFPDGTYLRTPYYRGRVTDYNISIQESMIIYTINGYSELTAIKDAKISKKKKDLKKLAGGTYNPLMLVKGLLEEQIAEQGLPYKVEFGKDNNITDISTLTDDADLYAVAEDDRIFDDINDQYVMSYIKSVLNQTRQIAQKDKVTNGTPTGEDSDSNSSGAEATVDAIEDATGLDDELILYDFVVSDNISDTDGTVIKIVAIDPSKTEEKNKITLTFDWMSGKMTDIVRSFQPDFSGSVAIAIASGLYEGAKTDSEKGNKSAKKIVDAIEELTDPDIKTALDSNGQIVKVLQSELTKEYSGTSGSSADADALGAVGITSYFEQAVYTANLRTLGLPKDVPMLTHIFVVPLIYGVEHHTGGEYVIQGQTDDISSQGFETTFKLFKVGSSKEYRERLAEIYGVVKNSDNENLKLKSNGEYVMKATAKIKEYAKTMSNIIKGK